MGNLTYDGVHAYTYDAWNRLVTAANAYRETSDDTCESEYFALTGANYNVLALVDAAGAVAERYEYGPYGQRRVYFSPGTNDPSAHAPTRISRRHTIGGVLQPYGLNAAGHQGLLHDEALGLVHNRARTLHPRLRRFMQRDPAGYVDGMSLYQYERSAPTQSLDPTGNQRIIALVNGQDFFGLTTGGDPENGGLSIAMLSDLRSNRKENIVKAFEEDADWGASVAKWIDEEQDTTPNEQRQCRPHSVIIVGHSNGGDAARKTAIQLQGATAAEFDDREYEVQLLVLFDPIGKPWHPVRLEGFPPEPKPEPNAYPVPKNVEGASVYRQTMATFRVGFFILQGYGLQGVSATVWDEYEEQFDDPSWQPHADIVGRYAEQTKTSIENIKEWQ